MRKIIIILTGMLLFAALSIPVYSQTGATVTGTVKNSKSGEKIAAVSITVKGAATGTYTDDKGNFKLFSVQKPPFTIVVSSVGYANREVNIESSGQAVNVELEPTYVLGEDIVVAASRLPERILESPVSIERISTADIRNAPASSYYDVIANVKGVDVTTASLTFKTIT
ncbi:MAG: carboxypeptidase-like regulatory domain-containing protein, partial [Parafilimonas sp.]